MSALDLPDLPPAPIEPVIVRRANWLVTGVLGALLLGLGLGVGYAAHPLLDSSQIAVSPANTSGAPGGLLELITSQVRHFKGSARAPVTIIEYGDFQ